MEVLQAWKYFSEYPDDAGVVKGAVAAAFLTDSAATMSFYAGVYLVWAPVGVIWAKLTFTIMCRRR